MRNLLVVGGGSSILNYDELCSEFHQIYVMTSSPPRRKDIVAITVDWEDLNLSSLKALTGKIDVVLFTAGKWLPGKITNFNSAKFCDLLGSNAFIQYDVLRYLIINSHLNRHSVVKLISSQVVEKFDSSAPEYSLSKSVAELILKAYCTKYGVKYEAERFGLIGESKMFQQIKDRYGNRESSNSLSEVFEFIVR